MISDYDIKSSKVSEVLFGSKVKKKLNNNVDKLVRQVNINAKSPKLVPVATGKTLSSVRMERLGTNTWQLSSINWGNWRYDWNGVNNKYTTYTRGFKITVPRGKNAHKYNWFMEALNKLDNQGKVSDILLDIYD